MICEDRIVGKGTAGGKGHLYEYKGRGVGKIIDGQDLKGGWFWGQFMYIWEMIAEDGVDGWAEEVRIIATSTLNLPHFCQVKRCTYSIVLEMEVLEGLWSV